MKVNSLALNPTSIYFLLLGLILSSHILIKGQDSITMDNMTSITSITKIGIYATIDDLLDNKPSDTSKFIIKNKLGIVQLFTFSSPNKLKYFDLEANKYKKYKDKFWGVYDGETLFIYHANVLSPINLTNRFSEFQYSSWRFIIVWIPIPIPVPMNYKSKFVYDQTIDKKVWLKTYQFEEFLKEVDIELYNQFNNEHKKKKKIEEYIDKLNKKYPNN